MKKKRVGKVKKKAKHPMKRVSQRVMLRGLNSLRKEIVSYHRALGFMAITIKRATEDLAYKSKSLGELHQSLFNLTRTVSYMVPPFHNQKDENEA